MHQYKKPDADAGHKAPITAKQYATWKAYRHAGIGQGFGFNEAYNREHFGMTLATFHRINKCVIDMVGSMASNRELPSLAKLNENLRVMGW